MTRTNTETRTLRHPIIAFAPHPWDELHWMNRQHILSRLAMRGWPVVYSMGALDIWQRGGKRWRQADWFGSFEHLDGVLLDRPGRIIPRWQRNRAWDAFALKSHARRLIEAQGTSNEPGRIAFLFHPLYWPYVEYLAPSQVIFHCYDIYWQMDAWSPVLQANLERLVERADLLTASSDAIANALPGVGARKARVLPNAVDIDLFLHDTPPPCPPDLETIPRPRIASLGQLNRKIDFGLIAEIGKRRPDWHWVLIGGLSEKHIQKDPEIREGWEACKTMPNVHYLGEKSRLEIPAYAYNVDINVMCYRVDGQGWWRSGYPLKLHEYLAVGLPILSADIESVRPFANVIDIAHSNDEWIQLIERNLQRAALGSEAVERRRAVALENTWEQRVDQLEDWLFDMMKQP